MARYIRWIAGVAVVAGLTAGGLANAQEVRRETTRTSARTETSSRSTEVRRISTVVGGTVQFSDGGTVGRVEDIIISDGGCVDYVVVKYEDEFVPIPWSVTTVNFSDRIIRLDMTRSRFQDVPTFSRDDFHIFTDSSFTQRVNKFFDVSVNTTRRDGSQRTRDVDRRDGDADRDRDTDRQRDADRRDRDTDRDRDADRRDRTTDRDRATDRDRDDRQGDQPRAKDKPAERPAPPSRPDRPAPGGTAKDRRDVKPADVPGREQARDEAKPKDDKSKDDKPKDVKPQDKDKEKDKEKDVPGTRPPKPPTPSRPETPAPR